MKMLYCTLSLWKGAVVTSFLCAECWVFGFVVPTQTWAVSCVAHITVPLVPVPFVQPFSIVQAPFHRGTIIIKDEKCFSTTESHFVLGLNRLDLMNSCKSWSAANLLQAMNSILQHKLLGGLGNSNLRTFP